MIRCQNCDERVCNWTFFKEINIPSNSLDDLRERNKVSAFYFII